MYDQIAHYYELTHADLTEDVAWVVAEASKAGGTVLELGCGSGRLLWPLAEAGLAVVGVDNSAEMLAIAAQKLAGEKAGLHGRITLTHADMTQLTLPQRDFALALIPYNTLMHIPPEQMGRTLRAIAAHMRPGGRLLVDTANPLWLASAEESDGFEEERQFADPLTGEEVTQYARYASDPSAQVFEVAWRFVAEEERGGKREERVVEATAVYHYYYPHQLQLALAEAGWQVRHMGGGYEGEPFEEESERLVVVAEKG
jgi:SAM-dependent methyltransferase